jgi:hypothetical protein
MDWMGARPAVLSPAQHAGNCSRNDAQGKLLRQQAYIILPRGGYGESLSLHRTLRMH